MSPLSPQELAPKMKRRFDSFDAITDPSRNQKVLRAYQSKLPRPVVPFMPLVMKGEPQISCSLSPLSDVETSSIEILVSLADMAFLHEGNETMIEGLVNFEKMVSEEDGSLHHLSILSPSPPQRLLAEKVRSLFEFRTGSLPNDVCLLANKNPELQKYIR